MHKAKSTTPKALRIHLLQQEGTNNGVDHHDHEASFRVLYYGDASAGSVPFMWESHPGTPKHALTESSLPPLTPPPSFQNHISSSMQLSKKISGSKRSGFLRAVFLASSRKTATVETAAPSSFSSCSISSFSSSSSSSSHLHSSQSTPTRKTEVWRRRSAVKFGLEEDYGEQGMHEHGGGGGSPASTLCFGGGFRRGYRVKKLKTAIPWFVRPGKA